MAADSGSFAPLSQEPSDTNRSARLHEALQNALSGTTSATISTQQPPVSTTSTNVIVPAPVVAPTLPARTALTPVIPGAGTNRLGGAAVTPPGFNPPGVASQPKPPTDLT